MTGEEMRWHDARSLFYIAPHLVLQTLVLPVGPAPVFPSPLEVRQHRQGPVGQPRVRES